MYLAKAFIRDGRIIPHTQGVPMGYNFYLTCYSAIPPIWTFYDKKLQDYNIKSHNTIAILDATENNSGEYECRGRTLDGQIFRSTALVYVGSKLQIGTLQSVTVIESV